MNALDKLTIKWNPHLIELLEINRDAVDKLYEKECIKDPYLKSAKDKTAEFLQKYDRAREILYTFPSIKTQSRTPLAYRLIPQLSEITDFHKDVLTVPKFGGIPDMTWWHSFIMDYGMIEGGETQDLNDSIKEHWPVCGCCHKPLWFLGQLNMTDWARVIHLMTYENVATEFEYQKEEHNRHYYQVSGLGDGDGIGLNLMSHDLWWYLFYCDCRSYDINSSSAVVLVKHRFQGFSGTPDWITKTFKEGNLPDKERKHFESLLDMYDTEKREKCLWPKEDYLAAIEQFMEKNNRHPEKTNEKDVLAGKIPLQFVKGFDLRFDIDYPHVIHGDLYEALYYGAKKSEEDIFGESGTYHLFGRPHSQQEEPRYMCSYGYNEVSHCKLHRMAPIICWDDSSHDITRQMYGCLVCVDNQSHVLWARMDHSNT